MTAFRMAKASLLLFAFSLFWMKDPLIVGGLGAVPADLIFVVMALLFGIALLRRDARLGWSPGFLPLAAYFAALATSTAFSSEPRTSAFKLATEAYLVGIPVLVCHLVDTSEDLKRLFAAYIAGAAIVAVAGVGTLMLFPFFGYHSFLAGPLHHFGTLPPGPYPRLEITFEFPAMMANYLALAMMLLILARSRAWVSAPVAWLLGGCILLTALFALTPGFGGVLFMLGVWFWSRKRGTAVGRLSFLAGLGAGVLGAAVASVTPILHRTAPFLISIPGLPVPLAPAVRLLVWINAVRTFFSHPLVGIGIGVDPVHVPYANPSGEFTVVTDAHNMLLSIAAQAGILGVAGMAAIIWFALREMRREAEFQSGLSLAFLSGLVVEGLVGSFEDARHLWLAYGILLAAGKLEHRSEAIPRAV